jgi:excinuclease UvrABC nuclease subunit
MVCSGKFVALDWVGPLLFCAEEINRVPPDIAGVYIVHTFHAGRGWYLPIYVGKAQHLHRRLEQHLTSTTAPEIRTLRAQLRLFFSAAPVTHGVNLDSIEAGLIALLRPPFNRQVPKALPTWSTLPPMTLELEDP